MLRDRDRGVEGYKWNTQRGSVSCKERMYKMELFISFSSYEIGSTSLVIN